MLFFLHFGFFFFKSTDWVNYIDWIFDVKPNFYSWDKPYIVMIILFVYCRIRFADIFLRIFAVSVHKRYWLLFSLFAMFLLGFGIRLMLAPLRDLGNNATLKFSEKYAYNLYYFSLPYLREFITRVIMVWSFFVERF